VLDGIDAGHERDLDAVRTVRVHRDFLAVQPGGLDDRARFVVEHLLAETRTHLAVDPAGRGDLDHVHATAHLDPHGTATGLHAVTQVVVRVQHLAEVLAVAERCVHVP